MDNSLVNLLEERNRLYREMLEYSEQQMSLFEGEWTEEVAAQYEVSAEQWNDCRSRIEQLQPKITESGSGLNSADFAKYDDQAAVLLEQALNFQGIAENKLFHFMTNLGSDLQSLGKQRKVMNAYYGMNSIDQVAIYFDEKK